jgi:hypothetical protein
MTSNGEQKWLIPDAVSMTREERAAYWEDVHENADYGNVYSLTDDHALRDLLLSDLVAADAHDILIPGCGSRVELQRQIVEELPLAMVHCVDFPGVVAVAERRFQHPNVTYTGADVTDLTEHGRYDALVHVTSVVSERDLENRAIMRSTTRCLTKGGRFLGIFPTVFATLDIAVTTGETWRAENVDLNTSRYNEPTQGVSQIFYTPLRLRRIAKECGLTEIRMGVFFNDSDYLRAEGSRHYGLLDQDAVLYHLYLTGTMT